MIYAIYYLGSRFLRGFFLLKKCLKLLESVPNHPVELGLFLKSKLVNRNNKITETIAYHIYYFYDDSNFPWWCDAGFLSLEMGKLFFSEKETAQWYCYSIARFWWGLKSYQMHIFCQNTHQTTCLSKKEAWDMALLEFGPQMCARASPKGQKMEFLVIKNIRLK